MRNLISGPLLGRILLFGSRWSGRVCPPLAAYCRRRIERQRREVLARMDALIAEINRRFGPAEE
jgi:hypothetical protein